MSGYGTKPRPPGEMHRLVPSLSHRSRREPVRVFNAYDDVGPSRLGSADVAGSCPVGSVR